MSALFRFLTRSFFLNPLNNLVWPLMGLFSVYFIWEGTFKREHALLLTYSFPFLHLFLGNPFRNAESGATSFFERLPLTRRTVFKAFSAASILYLVLAVAFCFYLLRGFGPMQYFSPDATIHMEINEQGDTVTLMTGSVPNYVYGERPSFKTVTRLVGSSLVFDGLIRIEGMVAICALLYVLLLGVALLIHFRNAVGQGGVAGFLPFALYLVPGAVIMADPFLTGHATAMALRWVPGHAQGIFLCFASMAAINLVVLAALLALTLRKNRPE